VVGHGLQQPGVVLGTEDVGHGEQQGVGLADGGVLGLLLGQLVGLADVVLAEAGAQPSSRPTWSSPEHSPKYCRSRSLMTARTLRATEPRGERQQHTVSLRLAQT
jgi:hypothetical protein